MSSHQARQTLDDGQVLSSTAVPMHQQGTVSQHVDDILQHGIVQTCASPRGAPIVLVKKKNGTTGLCVDYRKLNDVTREDAYPVHRRDSRCVSWR